MMIRCLKLCSVLMENTSQRRAMTIHHVYGMHLQVNKFLSLKHDGLVNNVVFSPDGKYIATASCDNTAMSLWNASTGKQIFVLNHDGSVNNVVFSPDGKYIATASRDNTARLWNASTDVYRINQNFVF